jgi:TonB family protein
MTERKMLRWMVPLLAMLPMAASADPPPDVPITSPITVTNKPPPPGNVSPNTQVFTPVSIGKRHTCTLGYPLEALEQRAEGTTTLQFHVATDGSVKAPSVSRSSGRADLDTVAISCVSAWHYKPAVKDGAPVEMPWHADIRWKVGEPETATAPAAACSQFLAAAYKMPANISGRSFVVFLLAADGSATPKKLIESSGDDVLDQAAMRCVAARRFQIWHRIAPPDEFPEYTVVDWNRELAASK